MLPFSSAHFFLPFSGGPGLLLTTERCIGIGAQGKHHTIRLIKCQISRRIARSPHCLKRSFVLTAPPSQQSQSTYSSLGGETPALVYRFTSPSAIGFRPAPSLAVSTFIKTWPCSLATFVAQAAVPVLCPANFLTTFFVESILIMLPKVEEIDAFIPSILGRISWT